MKTKIYHSFSQKMDYFNDDLELIDIIRDSIVKDDLTDSNSKYLFKRVIPEKHKHISRRKNSFGSRELTINHLRKTVYTCNS
jgi:hypothetical protein